MTLRRDTLLLETGSLTCPATLYYSHLLVSGHPRGVRDHQAHGRVQVGGQDPGVLSGGVRLVLGETGEIISARELP